MNTWDRDSSIHDTSGTFNGSVEHVSGSVDEYEPQHEVQTQEMIPEAELIDSIQSANVSERQNPYVDEDGYLLTGMSNDQVEPIKTSDSINDLTTEQIQRVYYTKGLEELDSLNLVDLSPLANWKLTSFKQGFGLNQLRDDSPDTYWQSDGSNGNNNTNSNSNGMGANNQLSSPHSITIQFSKKVSLERISLFTNYHLDESYTPSKIKVMAGSNDGWDLSEVCTVTFTKPVGWSHIIFSGIRNDRVLKCFMIKLIITANHQDGKDTHIRALKCFGRKSAMNNHEILQHPANSTWSNEDILKDLSLNSAMSTSGFSINSHPFSNQSMTQSKLRHLSSHMGTEDNDNDNDDTIEENEKDEGEGLDKNISKCLQNVANVIGFNTGFQNAELRSVSSIR